MLSSSGLRRSLMAALGLAIMIASSLAAITPAAAETQPKIGTVLTIGVSRTDVTRTSGAIQVLGSLRRVSDKRLLTGAKIVLTATSISSGKVISIQGATTDNAGSYAMEVYPSVTANISVAFNGAASYSPSASKKVRIAVNTPGGRSASPDSPQSVTAPLIGIVCDGFKNTMGKFGGEGPTGEIVLGTFADQTTAHCKGENPSFFTSFMASLKEATGRLAIEKAVGLKENRDLADGLVNLFSVSTPRVKVMPASAARIYDGFLRNVVAAMQSAQLGCVKLSVPDAANCVKGYQASIQRMARLAV